MQDCLYSPTLKKGGGALLDLGYPSIHPVIIPTIIILFSLENKLIEFRQIFVYALILKRSRLGLLHIIFRTFVIEGF